MVRHYDVDPPAILGRLFSAQHRLRKLPQVKVLHYKQCIDDLVEAATQHPKRLVDRRSAQSVFGRVLFAADAACPTIWPVFLELLSTVSTSWSKTWLRLGFQATDLLGHISWILQHENGAALTPRLVQPLEDGLPVYVTYTDASIRGDGRSGYGGYVWRHGSNEVLFFLGTWDPEMVAAAGLCINTLEGKACNIADELANRVASAAGVGLRYVYQIGDSQVYFDHVAGAGHARSTSLRKLYRQRSQSAQQYETISCTLAVPRAYNKPSDALANGDVASFEYLVKEQLGGHVQLTIWHVPEQLHSIANLCA